MKELFTELKSKSLIPCTIRGDPRLRINFVHHNLIIYIDSLSRRLVVKTFETEYFTET